MLGRPMAAILIGKFPMKLPNLPEIILNGWIFSNEGELKLKTALSQAPLRERPGQKAV